MFSNKTKKISKSMLNLSPHVNSNESQSVLNKIKSFGPNWSQNNKTDDHKSRDALNGYNCDEEWGSDFDDDDEGANDQTIQSSDLYNIDKNVTHIDSADSQSSKRLGLNNLTAVEQMRQKFEFNLKTVNSKSLTPTASYVTSKPIIKSKPQVNTNKPMIFPKPVVRKNLIQSISPNEQRPYLHTIGSRRSIAVFHLSQEFPQVSKNNSNYHQSFCGPDKSETKNCENNHIYYSIQNSDLTDPQTLTQNTQQLSSRPLISTQSISGTNNNWRLIVNETNSVCDLQDSQLAARLEYLQSKYDTTQLFQSQIQYEAREKFEISLNEGELVGVIKKKDPTGNIHRWYVNTGKVKGFVPSKILIPYQKNSSVTPPKLIPKQVTPNSSIAQHQYKQYLKALEVPKRQPLNHLFGSIKEENNFETVLAQYSYEARSSQELSFKESDVITVLAKENCDWWKGQVGPNGAIGLFPVNYVQKVSTQFDVDGCIVSDKEYRRQKHIKEFIDSEDDYVRDLKIVVQVFQTPLSKCLTATEMDMIFGNFSQLLDCNEKFLLSLRNRKCNSAGDPNRETILLEISDIFCSHFQNMFVAYEQFCMRQLSASQLIQRKSDNDPRFKEMAKICSQDKRANGLPLNSYLLKPMQRMTKYPLLIKNILDYTPEGHSDYSLCQKAIKMAENLCSKVNTVCDTQENIKRLEWCQTQIQCDTLDYTIIFNSETNCLGPRKLLHSASLSKKGNISKQLMGFLFNDFLLLALPLDFVETTSELFKCDKAMASNYTVYRYPIMLNDIKEVSHFDAKFDPLRFKILLKSSDSFVHLKAISENDVSLWMKMIDNAVKHFRDVEDSLKESNSGPINIYNSREERGRLEMRILKGVQLSQRNTVLNALCELSIGSNGNIGVQTYKTKNIRCVASSTGELSAKRPLTMLKSTLFTPKNKRNSIAQCEQMKHNLFTALWDEVMLFSIYDDISDNLLLTVKFFDQCPYAPRSLQGQCSIRVSELAQEIRHTSGPVVKEIKLTPSDNKALFLSVQLMFEALHMYSFV